MVETCRGAALVINEVRGGAQQQQKKKLSGFRTKPDSMPMSTL